MPNTLTVFAVDDDKLSLAQLSACLKTDFRYETFASSAACLERVKTTTPDLFLIDIEMPGTNGYELCRIIKQQANCGDIPVVFVSGHDDIESRLAAFEVGAHEFISKPLNFEEIRQKINRIGVWLSERKQLQMRLEKSDEPTSLILGKPDEYSLIIKFLRSLNSSEHFRDVKKAIFELLDAYQLSGSIQIRMLDKIDTVDASGKSSPLVVSIFRHVASMGCVVRFQRRAAFNYGAISLLIHYLPVEDSDLCARLRDHLAIAVESANEKLSVIEARIRLNDTHGQISRVIHHIGSSLTEFRESCNFARLRSHEATERIIQKMQGFLVGLALTDGQEEEIEETLRNGIGDLAAWFDRDQETVHLCNSLIEKLSMATATTEDCCEN